MRGDVGRLAPSERLMVRTRAHPRALIGPAARLVAVAFGLGLLMGLLARPGLPDLLTTLRPGLEALVWAGAVVAVLLWTVRPAVRWATASVAVTTDRLVRRTGWGGGPDLARPLVDIADVRRRRRGGGAGDLEVDFSPDVPGAPDPQRDRWRLRDVPEAARFEDVLAELTRQARERAGAAWPADPPEGAAR